VHPSEEADCGFKLHSDVVEYDTWFLRLARDSLR
jgi:hypothetical protein